MKRMGKRIELSKRLKLAASFVEPGAVVADVGTDHGYVPIWLVQEGVAAGGIAMDVNPGPLERAAAHIGACGLTDRIQTRLGDGLSALSDGEADTVMIAGMGGPLITRILTDGLETAWGMKRLILSPQSEIRSVREFLERQGFVIEDEAMTEEDGKYYTVICARSAGGYVEEGTGYIEEGTENKAFEVRAEGAGPMDGRKMPGTDADESANQRKRLEWKYGKCLLEQKNPVLLEFLEKERKKYRQVLERLNSADGEHGAGYLKRQARKKEVEEELALIEEAMSGYFGN